MPSDYGISHTVISALTNLGFTVYEFQIKDATYKYKNIIQRLHNTFRKIIFQDFQNKRNLKMEARFKELAPKLAITPDVDYALFIRPDLFPKQFVLQVKEKSSKTVAYQWDGLNRFPHVHEYIELFDRFFTFDQKDIDLKKGILPLTNFYIPVVNHRKATNGPIYFLAIFDHYRFDLIKKLKQSFLKNKTAHRLILIAKDDQQKKELIEAKFPVEAELNYAENLHNVQNAAALIDLHVPVHAGLSFRVFEALNYGTKLITTNTSVKEYDFYHPNNIFIWNGINEDEIDDFLKVDYFDIDESIKLKYDFNNWIKYVLDLGEYSIIQLPQKNNITAKNASSS